LSTANASIGAPSRFSSAPGLSDSPKPASDDKKVVPAFLQVALCVILLVGGIASVPFLGSYSPLPMTALLDAWVVVFAVTLLPRLSKGNFGVLAVLAVYGFTRIFFVVASEAPVVDALQAYKWILYLLLLVVAVDRKWTKSNLLVRTTIVLIGLALLKSLATRLILGAGERPGLFTENNYEIALFAGLIAVVYSRLGRYRLLVVLALAGLTLLAGSRSGSVAVVGLVVYALSQSRVRDSFIRYLGVLSLFLMAAIPVIIFQSRAAVSTSIDRLNFLEVFFNEVSEWGPLEWIFGSTPITPLSDAACQHLSYYQLLFASDGSGQCYSVILHAFILRVLFDAGIFGLLLAFGVAFYLMRKARVRTALLVCLMFIAVTNSLSVSGLNNAYVALPIALAILTVAMPNRSRNEDGTDQKDMLNQGRSLKKRANA